MAEWLVHLQRLIDQGGIVMLALMLLSIILWALIIERFWFIHWDYPKQQLGILQQWLARKEYTSWAARSIRQRYLSECDGLLQQRQSTIRNLIALCPLLGLLGTVTGMISVFDAISMTGNSDAKAMASGIYRATLPTMAGLVLALSALYFSHRLVQKSKLLTERLAAQLSATEVTR